MNGKIRQAVTEVLEGRRLLAANLVSDAAGLLPADAVRAGGYDYFFADDGVHGRELWKSDGTAAGTTMVADVTPGAGGTTAYELTAAGDNVIFFTATAGRTVENVKSKNYTLWTSDGTAAGTRSGPTYANTGLLYTESTGDRAVFSAYTRDANGEDATSAIYGTDGTRAAPTTLKTFAGTNSDGDALVTPFHGVGDLAIAKVDYTLWSFDGTSAGTVDLTDVVGGGMGLMERAYYASDGQKMVFFDTANDKLWVTDGTAAGTRSRPMTLDGFFGAQSPVLAGDTAYVVGHGKDQVVSGVNINTGAATTLYTSRNASGRNVTITATGNGIAISDNDMSGGESKFLVSDGTAAGTKQLSSDSANTVDTVELDGVVYSVRVVRDSVLVGSEERQGGIVGTLGEYGTLGGSGGYEEDKVELWRTDGTKAGTGRVKVLLDGIPPKSYNTFTLGTANGKLTLRTEKGTFNLPNGFSVEGVRARPDYTDTTEVYDPTELSIGRNAAVARLVNGVLRIGGSIGDDNVLVYRRASDPEQLVVEYNGNTRVFKTAEVARIKADLQSGADRFEVREGDEGYLRLRTGVTGGDGNDTIITASGRDTISGGNGSDRIYAGRGADQVSGGAGGDRINGQSGDDRINAGTGRDRVTSGGGVDVLFGMTAVEMTFGTDADGQSYADDVLLA